MLQGKIKFLVFTAILFASCAERPPIPEKRFADLYAHLQLLDAQFVSQPAEEKVKVDSLLHALNVKDSSIYAELSWYGKNPERWQNFFIDVQAKLKELKGAYFQPKADAPPAQEQNH
ncbi:MAG: hypothetical protein WAO19_09070 [Candidatus Kryptoniota bacterium]